VVDDGVGVALERQGGQAVTILARWATARREATGLEREVEVLEEHI
jgi:hypothetical protein